ncbi:MAG: PAS-domain containing protein [Alphaproteobacteria bacterium]|jgi:signal transduction histidine kinase|nr:PAS-domain containing protein [Alphaproteobacteria bacterium]
MLAPELRAWLAPMLADHVDEAICVYDADDRVIAWNAAYPVLFPEVREMLRPGLPFLDTVRALFELQHPVDAETMEAMLVAAVERHRTVIGPLAYQRADGRWVELRMYPTPDGGRFKIWRDVTSRRLADFDLVQLNDALSTLEVGMLLFDRNQRLAFMNTRLFSKLMVAHVVDPPRLGQGGGRPAAMRRISATLVDSPDWRRLLALGPDEALDEPAVVQTIDGRWFRIQETRNVSGIAMIWVDISDRKRLEQDLMAAVAAEQQVRREQRQMLAMLSHEFRSPLTVIEATTQLLSVAGVDDLPRGLARIRRATQRLTSLIETCLADDRLDAGELRPKPAPFDLSSVLADIAADAGQARGGPDAVLLRAGPAMTMTGDAALIRIAVMNLVDNALKYAGDHGPIEIAATPADGSVLISVADSGPGIAPDDLERIFDKYFRAAASGRIAGAGLGLHLTRRIVEGHGGRIAATSGPGGSRFTIALPLAAG